MTRLRLGCDIPFFADPRDVREFAIAAEDLDQPGPVERLLTQQTPEAEWPAQVATYAELGVSDIGLGNRIVGGTVADQIAHLCKVVRALRPLL